MSLSPQFLDEIRARTSLSQLIGKSVPLKKAGREMRGCCPFHNEKSPSFFVNDEKGFYHCFGCSQHGDAIRWLIERQGMEFMDAVRELAQAAGMEMPAYSRADPARDQQRERGYEIMSRAAAWFGGNRAEAQHVKDYLKNRGIRGTDAAHFGIGFAPPGFDNLLKKFQDVDVDFLIKLGLARQSTRADGSPFDFFRDRLMIPIHDARGRVIGFGGRVLGDGEPKYLNSPDTPLFDKGRTLYNIHRASPAARKANRLIIVEGYMDVIALARGSIEEAVAPNGTALTEAQLQIAWRLVDEPILCFDGDSAGKKAAIRAAITALPHLLPGKSLRFVSPPAGQDPDDVVKQGDDAVDAMLAKPRPLVDILWESELNALPIDTPEQRAGLKKRLLDHVKAIRDRSVAEAYFGELGERFTARFVPGANPQTKRQASRPALPSRAVRPLNRILEAGMVEGMLRYPHVVAAEMEAIAGVRWESQAIARVVGLMLDAVIGGHIEDYAEAFAEKFAGAGVADLVREIRGAASVSFPFTTGAPSREKYDQLVAAIQRMPIK